MRGLYFSTSNLKYNSANSINVLNQSKAFKKYFNNFTVIHFTNNFSNKSENDLYYISFGSYSLLNLLKGFCHVVFDDYNFIYTRSKVFTLLFLIFKKQRLNYEIHDIPYTLTGKLIEYFIFSFFFKRIKIIFITNNLKLFYLERFPNLKHKVLADASNILVDFSEVEIKTQNFLYKPILTVGYLGSSKPGKGMDFVYLLSGLNKIFSFLIVGEDRKIDNKYLSFHNLKIYNRLSHDEGLALLKDFDIALLPLGSKVMLDDQVDIGKFTSPLKLFEYWSAGCLVVISGNTVLLDVCIPNYNCIKIDELDSTLWMNTLVSINDKREHYCEIIKNGYKHFRENYTWDIRAKLIIDFQNEK